MFALLACLVLAGCSERPHSSGQGMMGMTNVPASDTAGERLSMEKGKGESPAGGQYMAYAHSLYMEVQEERVGPVSDAALAACRDAAAEACTVLESQLSTGDGASARLKFRAKRAGIKKILAALSEQGGVVSQSTEAEDLAQPIADTAKKLEMLRDYRAKLEALRGRASTDVESLIKVNKELAQVQSDIEALAGEKAHLMQRVETEILNVNISSAGKRSFWRPIGHAFSNFGGNLAEALGSAITAIAFIIPWLPILFGLAWLVRKVWVRMRQQKAGA